MPATELLHLRIHIAENAFAMLRILLVEPPILGSSHQYKYSLAYIVNDECVLRYDNERGKGDHKHIGQQEFPVTFTTIENLIDVFQAEINLLRR